MIRLQKYLADSGVCSRRKAEELIARGKVTVNGNTAQLGDKVLDGDEVCLDGQKISHNQRKVYIALNKPTSYICSVSDKQGRTVMSLVRVPERLYPVGRLDKDSSGLVILTNDGDWANNVSHPSYNSEKEYFVALDQDLKDKDIAILRRGMKLAGKKLRPVEVLDSRNKTARLVLKQGVNRQVRRMLGKLGYTVKKLKRIRIGKLELGDLKEGQWKKINPEDIL